MTKMNFHDIMHTLNAKMETSSVQVSASESRRFGASRSLQYVNTLRSGGLNGK